MGIATLVPFVPFRFWALQDPVASELSDAPCGLRMVVDGGDLVLSLLVVRNRRKTEVLEPSSFQLGTDQQERPQCSAKPRGTSQFLRDLHM
jgi:hypothetical protein